MPSSPFHTCSNPNPEGVIEAHLERERALGSEYERWAHEAEVLDRHRAEYEREQVRAARNREMKEKAQYWKR